ncbi:hypothetical protein BGZ46_005556 [Entomortierella lignicola]|nr:hypothetical protein BGZ46_005556 [Entomortierella lignicola]
MHIAAIELEKENIQPIRQGRSAQVLNRLFTAQHDDRIQELALYHQRFQEELEHADELKDPLDVYMRYVTWTIENYPQGGAQCSDSGLVLLLEQAIRRFKDDERYINDPRFVKLFIIYSEKVQFAIEVFSFMESNRIGSEISMYYEEYADYLESRDEFEKARDVFLLGIHRRARPLGRLKRLFEEFERRAELYQQELERKAIENLEVEQLKQRPRPADTVPTNSGRRILGNKISEAESRHANETMRGHVPIGSSSSLASSILSRTSTYQRPNAKLEVFSDQNTQPSSVSKTKPSVRSQENIPWKDLGSDQVRRKENVMEATSWKGAKIPAEETLPRRPHPKLQVWRDTENAEPEQASVPIKPLANRNDVDSPPMSGPSQTALRETEVNNADQNTEPPRPLAAPHSNSTTCPTTSSGQDRRFPISINDRGRHERLMIDLKQIYVDGEELSIEEIKARRSHYAFHGRSINEARVVDDPSVTQHHQSTTSHGAKNDNDFRKQYKNIPHTSPPPHTHSDDHENNKFSMAVKPQLSKFPMDEEQEQLGFSRKSTASSPTLHTKYASAEMNKIFSDRSRARRSIDSQWSNEDNKGVDENELDRFTMAYSIPTIPWDLPPSSREFLENEIQNEYDDDDYQDLDGRTDSFVRRLEQGFASTITQDIEALKRRRDEEGESRLSFKSNKRNSSRFDASRRQSDITMAIQQRFQQIQQHGQGTQGAAGKRSSIPYSRSSLGRSHRGSDDFIAERPVENNTPDHSQESERNGSQTRPFQVFRGDLGSLDSDLNVPMLSDEPPPPFLDHEEAF